MRSNFKRKLREAGGNHLFPIFLKMEGMKVLIVGGGKVALEKLNAILANAPATTVRIVSKVFSPPLKRLELHKNIELSKKEFEADDLNWADIVFSAVNDPATSRLIHAAARKRKLLHNAADKPGSCDFYLGSVVTKGDLKVGISTNGKSPTIAKRLKSVLQQTIPDEINQVLDQLSQIRQSLRGDLGEKIRQLNKITSILAAQPGSPKQQKKRRKRRIR
jgi:siroheme synthase-like protein